MKYFTKEWAVLCERCGYHYDLTPSPSAKRRSEDYFRKLYQEKLSERLRGQSERLAMSDEELLGGAFDGPLETMDEEGNLHPVSEEMGEEEYRRLEEQRQAKKRALLAALRRERTPEEIEASFRAEWEERMAELSAVLPQEILDQVADIRVLALGESTREVKRAIARFCRQNEAKVEQANRAYNEYLDRKERRYPPELLEEYGFSDWQVTGLAWKGEDLELRLSEGDWEGAETCAVLYRAAGVLEQEREPVGARWLAEELYPVPGGGFECHTLLEKGEGEYFYFTLRAASIEIHRDL